MGEGGTSALLAKQTAEVTQSCLDVIVTLLKASEIDNVRSDVAIKWTEHGGQN